MQQRQCLQHSQNAAHEFHTERGGSKTGFAAKVRRQLGHKSDGQHLQQNAERIAASLPGQLLQPGQQWAQLLHREPQQPRRAAQRKQERKAGLVLF